MDIISDYRSMRRAEVGGKFHSQAQLRLRGIRIPEFLCLTNTLFERIVAPVRPRIAAALATVRADDRAGLSTIADQLQSLIRELQVDAGITAAVATTLARTLPDVEHFSVRACMTASSAQGSEDSLSNPFAGISESFLYVPRADLWPHIRACWASAFGAKALLYRLSQGIDPLDVAVVVGIQRMVFGTRSFVMFTCDPNSAARDTLVVAGHGIGEGVVQESVPVDHYFINAKTQRIEQVLADKDSMLTFDARAGHGLQRCSVPVEERRVACLSEAELLSLRDIGQRIERTFGWPQDIEGTLDADGTIHILQARPIAIDYTKRRIWTGLNVTESYPGVSAPLTYSLARLFYRVIFRDIYRRAGASDAQLHDNHSRLDRMIGYVNGRVYYSLNAFYLLHGMVPIFPWLCKAWENMVGLKTSYFVASGEAPAPVGKWQRRWDIARAMTKFVGEFCLLPRRIRRFQQWWQQRAQQARAVLRTQPDGLALTEEFHRLWRDVGREWGVTLFNDVFIFSLYAVVSALFKRWRLNEDPALLSNLLCGEEQLESVAVFLSVLHVADYVRADATLCRYFLQTEDSELVLRYRKRLLDSQLLALLDEHIARYGDRSMEDLKMESPSLRLDPTVLFRGIRRFLNSDIDVASCRQAERDKRNLGEQQLMARLGRYSPRRVLLRRLLQMLREVIAHRENSRYCRSELFGICRQLFQAQGEQLLAQGAIDAVEDVYFLTVEEICGYTDGTGVDESFRDVIVRRRRQVGAYANQEVPETLVTDGALRDNPLTCARAEPAAAGNELFGLGSSMGRACGRARVVLDPNAVEGVPPETILVAKETDPGWLFLMLASAGIVVERGSMLSHTAITGRKFGIPTVVGVEAACTRIPDGAALEIDGGSGRVKLLER